MLIIDGKVADWDLHFLMSIFELLDRHLEELDQRVQKSTDPDSDGLFDHWEEVCGVGFVASQRYLAAVYGSLKIEKPIALEIGEPKFCGYTVAQAVNHAANYWKHHDEWSSLGTKRELETRRAVESFGGRIGIDYPLACVLAEISGQPIRFGGIVVSLEAWRDHLLKRPNQSPETRPTSRPVSA